jgi:hypothetical protein
MRLLGSLVCAFAVPGAVIWGCNSLQSVYVPEERFPAAYAQALCTSLQHCCAENRVAFSYDECTAGWEKDIANLLLSPDAGGNYDPQVATQCVQLVSAAAAASCQPVAGSLSAARDVCQGVFVGQTPTGGSCTSSAQCAPVDGSTVECAIVPPDAGVGQLPFSPDQGGAAIQGVPVCVALPLDSGTVSCTTGQEGGTTTDPCLAIGMYCDPGSASCQPLNGMGGACDPSAIDSCAPGTFCMQGTCVDALPVGSACTTSAECDYTSMCDLPGTMTCVLLKQPGQACTSGSECTVGVCDATTKLCLTNAIATTAACNGAVNP